MDLVSELEERFPDVQFVRQETKDGIPTAWVARDALRARPAATSSAAVPQPFRTLYDLAGIDERIRSDRDGQPDSGLHRGLSPPVVRPQRGRAPEGAARRRTSLGPHRHRPVALGRLVRARAVGHVRGDGRGSPRPAAHPDAALVGGASAAQGPSQPGDRDGHVLSAPDDDLLYQEALEIGPTRGWGAAARRGRRPARARCSSTWGPSIPAPTARSG